MLTRQAFVVFLIFLYACSHKNEKNTEKVGTKKCYYIPHKISKFSAANVPCVDVKIEDKTISMEIDLGYSGNLIILNERINLFESEILTKEKSIFNFKGHEYRIKQYRIPKIQIGQLTFHNVLSQEETQGMRQDSTIIQDNIKPSPRDPARLGWKLFRNSNLLVDIHNSQIAFCDSFETLQTRGHFADKFVKAPLKIENGLLEIEAISANGPLECILDTGATLNFVNSELTQDENLDHVIFESSKAVQYPIFEISGYDFGTITFYPIPIQIPIPVNAILGMDFFENHIVFFDFTEKFVYFQKLNKKID